MKHIRTGLAGAALVLAAQLLPAATPAAHADPCFFGGGEFDNWYNGARWGATLSKVENYYANCVGAWDANYAGTWNGHNTKDRVWARSDGGQVDIVFARMDDGLWHAHDNATEQSPSIYRHVCEWPRDGNAPCKAS
jgi:hypothetical protein